MYPPRLFIIYSLFFNEMQGQFITLLAGVQCGEGVLNVTSTPLGDAASEGAKTSSVG
jgi:hypothetical protein